LRKSDNLFRFLAHTAGQRESRYSNRNVGAKYQEP
jgi:hypothetical protein